ncbi:hypothetical protein [uncultured Roseibium sp.]|uniref:hypothetical protein n=1 Tax=uncultured Roseibium sp. TaxID=1936171 RepID=UPI0026330F38|nr:hypothetical protein [uncultured Roseibium sp.]
MSAIERRRAKFPVAFTAANAAGEGVEEWVFLARFHFVFAVSFNALMTPRATADHPPTL